MYVLGTEIVVSVCVIIVREMYFNDIYSIIFNNWINSHILIHTTHEQINQKKNNENLKKKIE